MATAAKIVSRASIRLGVASIINPIAPESENEMFNELKTMIAEWEVKQIDLGDSFTVPAALGSEMNNTPDTDAAMTNRLAVRSASFLRKQITPALNRDDKESYSNLLATHMQRPEQPYPATLPVGSGRRGYPFARRYYREPVPKDLNAVKPDPQ